MKRFFLLAVFLFVIPVMPVWGDAARLITQSTSSDCGPAALATLLTFYLDTPASESEMMRLAKSTPATGTSLLGLQEATAQKSCAAESFRMDFATLRAQMAAYPTPVIVRLLLPEPHFVIVLAVGDEIAISDPASGHQWITQKAFLKRWLVPGAKEGYVFVAARPDGTFNERNLALTLAELAQSRRALRTLRAPYFRPWR